MLLAWVLMMIIYIFPEAGLVLFMSLYHWVRIIYHYEDMSTSCLLARDLFTILNIRHFYVNTPINKIIINSWANMYLHITDMNHFKPPLDVQTEWFLCAELICICFQNGDRNGSIEMSLWLVRIFFNVSICEIFHVWFNIPFPLRYLALSVCSPYGVPGWRKSQYSNHSKNSRAMVGWLVCPTTHSVSLDTTSYGAACAFTLATVRTSWATIILHFMQVLHISLEGKSLNI